MEMNNHKLWQNYRSGKFSAVCRIGGRVIDEVWPDVERARERED